jgi:hypothetical protein
LRVIKLHTTKTYEGVEVQLFHSYSQRQLEVSGHIRVPVGLFSSEIAPRYPLDRRLSERLNRCVRCGEYVHTGIESLLFGFPLTLQLGHEMDFRTF